jgi:methylamine dehydrogenase heavy chain
MPRSQHRFGHVSVALCALLALLLSAPGTRARAEVVGQVLELPAKPGEHWIWVADLLLRRTALVDAADGRFLGMLSAGIGTISPSFSREHGEIYLPETHYSRGTRGERSDVVTVYDTRTLAPKAEIVIPPKRGDHASGVATSALSDDDRFLGVFNLTPATSLTIVDLRARRFTSEISTPGCALVYPAGPRRFIMLCGDGALLSVTVDEAGLELAKQRSEPFFDAWNDPVTEKAVRWGDRWLFVSFDGVVHPVDISGEAPRFEEGWSLTDEADRADNWRVGGAQHLAAHSGSNRLYALMHQGGADTHKDPGSEVWVYDLERRERVARIGVRNPVAGFLGQTLGVEAGGFIDWLLQSLLPNPGVDRIQVTQGESPVLVTLAAFPMSVSVHDGATGEFLRDLPDVGFAGSGLAVP